jgi:hypothetical protein
VHLEPVEQVTVTAAMVMTVVQAEAVDGMEVAEEILVRVEAEAVTPMELVLPLHIHKDFNRAQDLFLLLIPMVQFLRNPV